MVSRGLPGDPGELPVPRKFEEWDAGGTRAWTIEGDDPEGPIVVFCHGWGESRHAVLERVAAVAPACARMVAWDLPGHGESARRRSALGATEWAALAEVVGAAGLEGKVVVLQGFSLGAGVCIAAGARMGGSIAGVIAEAPYRQPWTPAERVMRLRGFPTAGVLGPAMWVLGRVVPGAGGWRGFDRAEAAGRLRCPLLVVHGSGDEVSPIEDGRAIAEAGRGVMEVIEGAGHTDMWSAHGERTGLVVRSFLAGVRGH